MSSLDAELRYFEDHLAGWLEHHRGKHVAVRDGEEAGFFDTSENAYRAALRLWGNVPMLIKQVLEQEPVERIPALMCGLLDAHL